MSRTWRTVTGHGASTDIVSHATVGAISLYDDSYNRASGDHRFTFKVIVDSAADGYVYIDVDSSSKTLYTSPGIHYVRTCMF